MFTPLNTCLKGRKDVGIAHSARGFLRSTSFRYFGFAYIEPLALVRHGCGILLQAGIPCACRACAAPRRAE